MERKWEVYFGTVHYFICLIGNDFPVVKHNCYSEGQIICHNHKTFWTNMLISVWIKNFQLQNLQLQNLHQHNLQQTNAFNNKTLKLNIQTNPSTTKCSNLSVVHVIMFLATSILLRFMMASTNRGQPATSPANQCGAPRVWVLKGGLKH